MIFINKLYKIAVLVLIIIFTTISIFIIYNKNDPNNFVYTLIGDSINNGKYYEEINNYLTNKGKKIDYYNYSKKNISIKELTTDLIYLDNNKLKEYLKKSNIIILSIGEKEISNNEELINIENDLSNLIKELKLHNINICILNRINGDNNKKIDSVNKIYKNISKENKLIYIDISNVSINNDNFPSKTGYKEIGMLINKAIQLKDK